MARKRLEHQTMSEDRLMNLEMNIAHLEQKLEDLSDVVSAQSNIISQLKAKLNLQQSKIEEIEMNTRVNNSETLSASEVAARDKPPHY